MTATLDTPTRRRKNGEHTGGVIFSPDQARRLCTELTVYGQSLQADTQDLIVKERLEFLDDMIKLIGGKAPEPPPARSEPDFTEPPTYG